MRALVVEDEPRLAAGLRSGLEAEGYAVDVALTGTDGLWLAREHAYGVVLLDLMLPEVDGLTICRTLRAEQVWTPILMSGPGWSPRRNRPPRRHDEPDARPAPDHP